MRKPANESSQPYRQDLPGICAVQEEKSHAKGLQEADAGPAGVRDPAQAPPSVISLIIKSLMKVYTSPRHVLVSLICPAGPSLLAFHQWRSAFF